MQQTYWLKIWLYFFRISLPYDHLYQSVYRYGIYTRFQSKPLGLYLTWYTVSDSVTSLWVGTTFFSLSSHWSKEQWFVGTTFLGTLFNLYEQFFFLVRFTVVLISARYNSLHLNPLQNTIWDLYKCLHWFSAYMNVLIN